MSKPLNEILNMTEEECFAMKPAAERLYCSISNTQLQSDVIIAFEAYLNETDHLTNRQKAYGIVKVAQAVEES